MGELEAMNDADRLAITDHWEQTNQRRHELIEAKYARELSLDEQRDLIELQRLAGLKRQMLGAYDSKTY